MSFEFKFHRVLTYFFIFGLIGCLAACGTNESNIGQTSGWDTGQGHDNSSQEQSAEPDVSDGNEPVNSDSETTSSSEETEAETEPPPPSQSQNVELPDQINAKTIAAGNRHTCTLGKCWGNNDGGQAARRSFNAPPTSVVAGQNYTCYRIGSTGSVVCQGDLLEGRGLEPPSGDFAFKQISGGVSHMCGLTEQSGIECWGDNDLGQSDPPTGTRYIQVSAGWSHSCALDENGQIRCWGTDAPAIRPGSRFTQISSGNDFTCGLKQSQQQIQCWGDFEMDEESAESGFKLIDAGRKHLCAIEQTGNVQCWGANEEGQIDAPQNVKATYISAGWDHTCAVTENQTGSYRCWGNNEYSQSGGPYAAQSPSELEEPAQFHGGPEFNSVNVGRHVVCGTTASDTAHCWGGPHFGVTDPPDGKFRQISSGSGSYACGITESNEIECWGGNDQGQNFGQTNPPDGKFEEVAVMDYFACARDSSNEVRCWGRGYDGNTLTREWFSIDGGNGYFCGITNNETDVFCLGDGAEDQAEIPPDIVRSPHTEIVDVSAGTNLSCALMPGQLDCWGKFEDQFDKQNTTDARWIDVEAKERSVCIRNESGEVNCWSIEDHRTLNPPGRQITHMSAGGSLRDQYCGLTPSPTGGSRMVCWGAIRIPYFSPPG